jgi:peroxiredoxin
MEDAGRQAKFTSRNEPDYPLLRDLAGRVAGRFGVKRPFDF